MRNTSAMEWETPSLCGAWTVAQVATHLTSGPATTLPGVLTAMLQARGRFAGSGPRVEGPAEALALAITRRPVRLDELSGPGADALREWAARG